MIFDVRPLQQRLGLTADGVAGPMTFAALFRRFGASQDRARDLAIGAQAGFYAAGLMENSLRLAHFMAQVVHESGGFRYMEEIASGAAYEGRADLGNTQPGDGRRFKGRGPIQITGRANYRKFGQIIGVDLITEPTLAARPDIGMRLALAYWTDRRLNAKADADDVRGVTRAINGGFNGLADRQKHLSAMKALLS